jgi:hypothetical protein
MDRSQEGLQMDRSPGGLTKYLKTFVFCVNNSKSQKAKVPYYWKLKKGIPGLRTEIRMGRVLKFK